MTSPARPAALAALAALAAALSLWIAFLDAPLQAAARSGDVYGDVASTQAKFAWNFVIHPPSVHGFWPLQNESTAPADKALHYPTHPPLLSFALAGAQRLLGREAFACRLPPLIFGVISFLAFLGLARRTLPGPLPWYALACFATLPLTIRHGTFPNYEPACQALLLGCWFLYVRDPQLRRGTLAALAGLWIVGAWTDVGGHFGPLAILVDVAVFRTDLGRRRFALAGAAALLFGALAALVQLHSAIASGEPFSLRRITGGALEHQPDWDTFANAMLFHGWHLLGLALTLLPVGLVLAAPAALRRGRTPEVAPLRPWLAILCVGLGNCLLMRRHAVIHDFWLFYTGPAVATLAALALWRMCGRRATWTTVAVLSMCAVQLVAGARLWRGPSGTAARDFGVAVRACVDGDRGEVALAPFRPATDRTVGFHARAFVVHFVGKDDPALRAHLTIQGLEQSRKLLVLRPAELAQQDVREYLEAQFPGVVFEECGALVRADVTRFLTGE